MSSPKPAKLPDTITPQRRATQPTLVTGKSAATDETSLDVHAPFLANVKTVFFYLWPTAGDKNDALARYVIKTILYGLWVFRDKATFHNGTETSQAIVRYISNDIRVRLKTDFSRMPILTFSTLWGDSSLCNVTDSKLEIKL